MAKKKKRTVKTPEKMIEAWILMQPPDSTFQSVSKKMKCCSGAVSRWVHQVQCSPELREMAEKKLGRPGREISFKRKEPPKGSTELVAPKQQLTIANLVKKDSSVQQETLAEEVGYLRWCLEGERNGYVERLLKELGS